MDRTVRNILQIGDVGHKHRSLSEFSAGKMNVLLAFLCLLFAWQEYAFSFRLKPQFKLARHSTLSMGGGRSPAEKTLSKKGMFQELKSKLNEAAQIPGFFDAGDGPPVIFVTFMSATAKTTIFTTIDLVFFRRCTYIARVTKTVIKSEIVHTRNLFR